MTGKLLIVFMKRLIKSIGKKLFLILDNLVAHRSKLVKDFLKENKDKIEVFYLPTYSPELNPDEYFNNFLKRTIEKRGDSSTKEILYKNVKAAAFFIQNYSFKIVNLFKAKNVIYAS